MADVRPSGRERWQDGRWVPVADTALCGVFTVPALGREKLSRAALFVVAPDRRPWRRFASDGGHRRPLSLCPFPCPQACRPSSPAGFE